MISVLSLIATLASVAVAVLMFLTRFNEPVWLYLAVAILLCNAIWHLSNFVVGLKLRSKLEAGTTRRTDSQVVMPASSTTELLEAGSPRPLSVVEATTRDLTDQVRR